MGFVAVPQAPALVLANASVPGCFLGEAAELTRLNLAIVDGRLAEASPPGAPVVDLGGGMVWPGFVDLHTHIDKGHIWPRQENPDGTFEGALKATTADRAARWSAEDVRRRMDFSLRCAHAHGTVALRTHLDSLPPQDAISWPVFTEMRAEWRDRITLQAASIITVEAFADDRGRLLADRVAAAGGVLGCVTYPVPGLPGLLDTVVRLAAERGLDLDLHVDESADPASRTLDEVARAVRRNRFSGRVLAGHCCSLAQRPDAGHAMELAAEAGIAVVSLPMCNMFLQDRVPGRTPRWRGVTLLHELKARGIAVAIASDNTRDPFYGYGDLDMLEVFREAVRIGHLDRPVGDWPLALTATPAAIMGLDRGHLRVGAPADLVLFRGRNWSELLSRPQGDRVVLRAGRPIAATPPDYAELDDLFR